MLTHADLGLQSFLAQVFIQKPVEKVCKVSLIKNELSVRILDESSRKFDFGSEVMI